MEDKAGGVVDIINTCLSLVTKTTLDVFAKRLPTESGPLQAAVSELSRQLQNPSPLIETFAAFYDHLGNSDPVETADQALKLNQALNNFCASLISSMRFLDVAGTCLFDEMLGLTQVVQEQLAGFGLVTTMAGALENGHINGCPLQARFDELRGIAVDKQGNLFVCDASNRLIRKISKTVVDTFLVEVNSRGISITSEGTLIVLDYRNGKIIKTNTKGEGTKILCTVGMWNPVAAATDENDNTFVAGYLKRTAFKKINCNAEIEDWSIPKGSRSLFFKYALAFLPNGDLLVAYDNKHLHVIPKSKSGHPLELRYAAGTPKLKKIRGIAVDKEGTIYVTDAGNFIVNRITKDGVISVVAGKPGESGFVDGIGENARFTVPRGIAIDNEGNLFVTDNNAIRKISILQTTAAVDSPLQQALVSRKEMEISRPFNIVKSPIMPSSPIDSPMYASLRRATISSDWPPPPSPRSTKSLSQRPNPKSSRPLPPVPSPPPSTWKVSRSPENDRNQHKMIAGEQSSYPSSPAKVLQLTAIKLDNNVTDKTIIQSKIAVVGNGGAGKTHLIHNLMDKNYQITLATDTVDVHEIIHQNSSTEVMKLSIWDFGGQEAYNVSHPFFLGGTSIFLVVWNTRSEDTECLRRWIKLIRMAADAGDIDVVIVGTRTDELNKSLFVDHEVLQEISGAHVNFFKVSNITKEGINELKQHLITLVEKKRPAQIPMECQTVLAAIKSDRQKLGKDVIVLKDLAKRLTLDPAAVRVCVKLLHNYGEILLYDQIDRTHDFIFVQPQFVIDIIKMLMNQGRTKQSTGGVLNKEDLEAILPEAKYSASVVVCLRLLGLIHPIVDSMQNRIYTQYLVPTLLPLAKPQKLIAQAVQRLPTETSIGRRIAFSKMVLDGVFGRVVSYFFNKSSVEQCWRDGILLDFGQQRILIERRGERKDTIEVIGVGHSPLPCVSSVCQEILRKSEELIANRDAQLSSLCSGCLAVGNREIECFSTQLIEEELMAGSQDLRCLRCRQAIDITTMLWNADSALLLLRSKALKFDDQTLKQSLGEYANFPLHNLSPLSDVRLLKKQSLSYESFIFYERLGRKTQSEPSFNGTGAAVYLVRCKVPGLQDANRFYALKIVYNYDSKLQRSEIEKQSKDEYSLQEDVLSSNSFTSRVLAHFVDQFPGPEALPDWTVDKKLMRKGRWTLCILMDLYDNVLKPHTSQIDKSDVRIVIVQILKALDGLYHQRIVHRDLKLDNVLWDKTTGCIVIADFGLATKLLDDFVLDYDGDVAKWGNPASMPPEVALAKRGTDINYSKADVWSAGSMVLDMLQLSLSSNDNSKFKEEHVPIAEIERCLGRRWGFLMGKILKREVKERWTASEALVFAQCTLWCDREFENESEFRAWKNQQISDLLRDSFRNRISMEKFLKNDFLSKLSYETVQATYKFC